MTGGAVDLPPEALGVLAALHGLDDPERRALWQRRLELDRSAVRLLAEAPVPQEQGVVDVHSLADRVPRRMHQAGPDEVGARVHETARQVRAGEVRAVDRARQALELAREHADLNALTRVFDERLIAEAEELDRRVAGGEDVGPLAGVTVAVKDLIAVAGHATSGGTRVLSQVPADSDAPSVARLRAAGALVVGMANLHGLAYGTLSTNPDFGRVHNPTRPAALAGGSSGGSAAAVAVGIVDLALGTDTAGSIRIPAAACGVVGLKPTFGRVPTAGALPLGRSLDHVGPLTGSVADAAAALEVLSDVPFPAAATRWSDLSGVVVGLPQTYALEHLDPQVRARLEDCAQHVLAAGGRVVDVDVPSWRWAPAAQLHTLAPEAFDVHRDLLRTRAAEGLPDDVRLRLEMGMFFSAADYVRAQRLRAVMQRDVDRVLDEVDVVLTPTLAVTVPDAGVTDVEVQGARWTTQFALSRLTMPANATGHPALSLPWGTDDRGVPIGVHLLGAAMDEATVLGVAGVLERSCAAPGGPRT